MQKIAVLLLNGTYIPRAIPNAINEEVDKKTAESYFTKGLNKVNEFIAGAELYKDKVAK